MSDLQDHLNTLSEATRVRLLAVLADHELDVGELTRVLQLPQSTVSRHLKALRVAGWVRRRHEGTSSLYGMDAADLDDRAMELWALVRDDFADTRQHGEDRHRLAAALAERKVDGSAFFGQVREGWDAVRRELFGDGFLLPTLLSLLPEGLTVADLGCGTGEALVALAPICATVIGVDRETAMLDVARARTDGLDNVKLRQGGLQDLPLSDHEADAALLMLVLHHVDDPAGALREAGRVARRLVVLDMVAHDRVEYRQSMGHRHLGFTRQALESAARHAGLQVRSYRTLPSDGEAQGPPLFVALLH